MQFYSLVFVAYVTSVESCSVVQHGGWRDPEAEVDGCLLRLQGTKYTGAASRVRRYGYTSEWLKPLHTWWMQQKWALLSFLYVVHCPPMVLLTHQ